MVAGVGTQLGPRRVRSVIGTGPWAHPTYESLSRELARAIGDGRLPVGARLPSERELATGLGLSRTTTTRAYAQLREQGYLVTKRGSGSRVRLPEVQGGRIDHLLAPSGSGDDEIDLTITATPAPSGLHDAYEAALHELPAYLPGTGYYPSGLPLLKETIADRYTAAGLPTSSEQILVTTGSLSALAIAVRSLDGSRVLVESPTYPNAIATIEAAGRRLVSYPLERDAHGHHWDPAALLRVIRQSRVRSAYLIPDFHNPTGALMPIEVRIELGQMLRAQGVVPIIDESLAEVALDGQRLPSLARWIPDSITLGSLSKSCWGGLRIGWLRAPLARVQALAASRLSFDLGSSVLDQLVAVELLRTLESTVAEARTRLRTARDRLVADLAQHLPQWQVNVPAGGLALWCHLPDERSAALSATARNHGVVLASGPNFAPLGGLDRWLRLPYTVPLDQLSQIGQRLARAWAQTPEGRSMQAERDSPIVV